MTSRLFSLLGVFLLAGALGVTTTVYAQRGPGMGQRMYDPSTVETVTGIVTAVDTVTGRRNRQHQGIHVRMTAAGEPSMIAAELTRQDRTWILRDEQGFPRWRGQRRQN